MVFLGGITKVFTKNLGSWKWRRYGSRNREELRCGCRRWACEQSSEQAWVQALEQAWENKQRCDMEIEIGKDYGKVMADRRIYKQGCGIVRSWYYIWIYFVMVFIYAVIRAVICTIIELIYVLILTTCILTIIWIIYRLIFIK